MHAHIEPLTGVVRIFADGTGWGDPYEWSCTVRWKSITEVELLGVTKPPTLSQMRALSCKLKEVGVTVVSIRRRGIERRKTVRCKEAE